MYPLKTNSPDSARTEVFRVDLAVPRGKVARVQAWIAHHLRRLSICSGFFNTCLVIFGVLTPGSAANAQRVSFVGEALVITDGTHRIRLPNVIGPHPESRIVHAVQKRAGEYFIVIGVSELSRGYPPRNGYCGAGIESHIDWLHVQEGKIVERQSGLYASCWKNRDGYSIEWEHGVLLWSTEGQRVVEEGGQTTFIQVTYSWKFDPSHPEKGIEEHTEDVKPTTEQ